MDGDRIRRSEKSAQSIRFTGSMAIIGHPFFPARRHGYGAAAMSKGCARARRRISSRNVEIASPANLDTWDRTLPAALPIVIEIVDSAEKIQALLPKFDEMIVEGLVTLEKVRVIAYRCEQDA